MAYLKPPLLVRRMFNPLAARFGLVGVETVVVPGRRSGQPRKVPVRPLSYGGARYLVSTYGEAYWVRNIRASGGKGGASPRVHENAVFSDRSSSIGTAAFNRLLL